MKPEEYLKNRLEDQINWYGKKSRTNQIRHKQLETVKIILAVSIPVVTLVISDETLLKIVVAVLGALIAILESVSRLHTYKDLWVKYRMVAEALKREKIRYDNKVQPYHGENTFNQLVQRCEKIMASENSDWSKLQDDLSTT